MGRPNNIENDADRWIIESRLRLARRRAEKPATKAGQIRALWPEIVAALENGQSIKSVRHWLQEDAGIVVGISSLTSYISRIRRRETAIQSGEKSPPPADRSAPAAVPAKRTDQAGPQGMNTPEVSDPIAQAMRTLTKPRLDIRELHNDGDPTGKSLI